MVYVDLQLTSIASEFLLAKWEGAMLLFYTPMDSKSSNVSEEVLLTLIDNTGNLLQMIFALMM